MTLKNIFKAIARLSGGIIPLVIIHLFCCGTLLVLLITSGYLAKLSIESQNKFLFLPSLALLFFAWWQLRKQSVCNHPLSAWEKICRFFLYLLIYAITSYLFITYIFIPWWIPGYEGGQLLP